MSFELHSLIGQLLPLYKVRKPYFWLSHYVFEAVIDDDDGHRSRCAQVIDVGTVTGSGKRESIHPSQPLTWVQVEEIKHTRIKGWQLRDESGHIWLVVGTYNEDDDYPCYEFMYTPKKGFR